MEFPNGVITNSSTTYTSYVDRLYATAKKGWFQLRPSFNAVGINSLTTRKETIELETKPYQQIDQLDAFAQHILEDKPLTATGEEGLIDMQIIEAVFKSIDARKWVDVRYKRLH